MYGNLDRKIDRDMQRRKDAKKEHVVEKRNDKPVIAIYCLPIIETMNTLIRCIFCGHPVFETRNRVLYISAYPASSQQRVVHDTTRCKRCGQAYAKLV